MARDDYYVIVYQILSYLYQCLKTGKDVEEQYLSNNGPLFSINEKYWKYIMTNLQKDGYIQGIIITNYDNEKQIEFLRNCEITPKGIQFLNENTIFKRIKNLVEAGEMFIPFMKI